MAARTSVYERRELTVADRLRRLLGREKPAPIAFNAHGNPILVVERGELVGVRDVNAGLVRFPDAPPDQPDLWPDESWDRLGEVRPWR